MKHGPENTPPVKDAPQAPARRLLRKAAAAAAWTVGGLALLLGAGLAAVTLWLTPQRLTDIVNRQAGEYFMADVRASNVRFTLWSSLPHLRLLVDSVRIDSRTLRGVSPEIRRQLPADCDFLGATGRLEGSVNLLQLLRGRIRLHDVVIEGLRLNMVAYNDSVNNYDIIPRHSDSPASIPYVCADTVVILNPRHITYYSAATETSAKAELSDARLSAIPGRDDAYRLRFDGKADASVHGTPILRGFPFGLDGETDLSFNPFKVRFVNFGLTLGDLKGNIDMGLDMSRGLRIDDLAFQFRATDLLRSAEQLAGGTLPALSGLKAHLTVDASGRLTAPYVFSASSLPSFEIDMTVPDGQLTYAVEGEGEYTMRHEGVSARLVFDGDTTGHSRLDITGCRLLCDGVELDLKGSVTGITGRPHVIADLHCDADLGQAGRIPYLRAYSLGGHLSADTRISADISGGTRTLAASLAAVGYARLRNVSFAIPGTGVTGKADHLDMHVTGGSKDTGGDTGKGVVPADISLTASGIKVRMPADTLTVTAGSITASGSVRPAASGENRPDLGLDVAASRLRLTQPRITTGFDMIQATLGAKAIRPGSRRPAPPATMESGYADSLSLATLPHTPEWLVFPAMPALRSLMDNWEMTADIEAAGGNVVTRHYPVRNRIGRLSMHADFDSLALRHLGIRSQSNAAAVSLSLGNLRQALSYDRPAPLPLKMTVTLDTVNINQISRAYETGLALVKGAAAAIPGKRPAKVSAADTTALLLPRNLTADIKATARRTVYTSLQLHDLSAGVHVARGDMDIRRLRVSADFGHASLGMRYTTSDVQRMKASLNLGVREVDVVRFFESFRKLLARMPYMSNLSGFISAEIDGEVSVFPDMYLDIPSVGAVARIQGRELTVHQSPFIRRITRMMLIRTTDDIHIANINIRASVHDNLLELYPFDFEFDRYKLTMLGVNNFAGRLYYHLGVDKSPVPFPFGINISGRFRNPHLHFGGASYKVRGGEEVTSEVAQQISVNLLRELRFYTRQFVHKAAQSDDSGDADYIYLPPAAPGDPTPLPVKR